MNPNPGVNPTIKDLEFRRTLVAHGEGDVLRFDI
jgi:hypothetical protein